MRLIVFGSSNLTAVHLPALVATLRKLAQAVDPGTKLTLVHGDTAPGSTPGAIGAVKLSEVAATIAWEGRPRAVSRHPVSQAKGETRGDAVVRRIRAMLKRKPVRAVCFHTATDFELPHHGQDSTATARVLREHGVGFLFVHLSPKGEVLGEEERR